MCGLELLYLKISIQNTPFKDELSDKISPGLATPFIIPCTSIHLKSAIKNKKLSLSRCIFEKYFSKCNKIETVTSKM